MKAVLFALFAAGVLVSPQPEAAFIGHDVRLTFEEPDNTPVPIGQPSPPPITQDFGVRTVGSGIEYVDALDWDIDISDSRIIFSLGGPEFASHWSRPLLFGFQGFRLRDVQQTLPDIVGVTIEQDSHVGLRASQVSFDADNILVDMELFVDTGFRFASASDCATAPPGLCVPGQTIVRTFRPEFVLNVAFAQVDEPAILGLLCIALATLAVLGRNRRKRIAN